MSQKVNAPARCNNCGQEWPRDPAYEVPCPVCGAAIGKPCMRPSEHTAWQMHPERDQAAMDAGKMQPCPKGKSAKKREADALQLEISMPGAAADQEPAVPPAGRRRKA